MTETKANAQSNSQTSTASKGFTDDEKEAMRERAKELKAEKRRSKSGPADGEADLLAKVADMPPPDREMAERVHAIVRAAAPGLEPKTWYGMPAYARDGKVVCFFQPAAKFAARYATFGFNDTARLDDGAMWPTSWALRELTPAAEAMIEALVKKA